MNQNYNDLIEQISDLLFETIVEQEPNLAEKVTNLDRDVLSLLRAIGLRVMSMLLSWLVNQVTNQMKKPGWVVHRRPQIKYTVIFGQLKIESPYLWNKTIKRGVRSVVEQLGISQGDYSIGVKQALTEFGAEESFEGAAKRFQEHYGFWVERNAVRREVETIAAQAQQYIEHRLDSLKQQADDHQNQTQGLSRLIVELDGCQIRTGVYFPSQKAELTPKRQLAKKERKIDWREVRVGFARPVEDRQKRTFIARMDKYPAVVQQLVSAAIDQGMGTDTEVTAVADGGNGLREALERGFPKLKFILDRIHLKQHIYQTADALGLTGIHRHIWTSHLLSLIDRGKINKAIKFINRHFHNSPAKNKLDNLSLMLSSSTVSLTTLTPF
ncbi:UPF0236 family transposase-like protein [Pleurocapsa sp. PCC 7319]|uniref:UPF0236 family transposase-like protein n=1 Tax=Pleurocapsa sp. PCC 7319 TaxID=118161 RepID=UPI00036CDC5B|nr:UPF0236 family protein [Pleurocapsa sp. PCC 7319]